MVSAGRHPKKEIADALKRAKAAGRHPKKEIADALKRAKAAGFEANEIHRGHRWGEVVCPSCPASRDVYSTPRSPSTHAKQIDRFTLDHTH